MGYTTDFDGQVEIKPPLNKKEVEYINKFADTRRMNRKSGAYFVDGDGFRGQDGDADVIDHNCPPAGQPSLWCQWVATEDGKYLEWDGGEKFYSSEEWMQYLIKHFLGTNPRAQKELPFLKGHTLNGTIDADGEDGNDHWRIIVEDNVVSTKHGHVVYD